MKVRRAPWGGPAAPASNGTKQRASCQQRVLGRRHAHSDDFARAPRCPRDRRRGDRSLRRHVRVRARAGRVPLLSRRSAGLERRARALSLRLVCLPRLGHWGAPAKPSRGLRRRGALVRARSGRAGADRRAGRDRVRGDPRVLRRPHRRAQPRRFDDDVVLLVRRRLRDRAARCRCGRLARARRRQARGRLAAWQRLAIRCAMIELILAILAAWFLLLFAGPAIYATMGLAGFTFLFAAGIPGIVIPQKIAMAANSFPLLAAPLFVLMGNLMNSAGITYRIFDFAKAIVGWMRGGLCQANIVGSVIFAGMSGSAVADAAGLGTVEIEAMKREGYDAETAGAITAASATIGPIIPPSLPMIVYGVAAETSIGALFVAGVIPGLLMAAALMLMVRRIAIRERLPRHPFEGWREVGRAFRRAFWALLAPFLLI